MHTDLAPQLLARVDDLGARLRSLGSVLVAFSGGADSALVLAAAVRALGPDRVAAATAVSASLAGGERDQAGDLARGLGARWLTPRTHEMDREGYRANDGDRCFHCKAELLDVLVPLAREHGLEHVATGTNADDLVAGFRPGIRAASERGAVTPLADAGLTKDDVRRVSLAWGLPTWDKPAAACLSSRVAFGIEVTPARLVRVDRAERAVRAALGGAGVPVRDLGPGGARVELDADALAAARSGGRGLLDRVRSLVVAEGFARCEVDPRGFRSGSMNELLPQPERFR